MATRRVPRIRTRPVHEADSDLGYIGSILVDGNRVFAAGGSYGSPTLLVSDDGARSFRALAHPQTTGLREIVREGNAHYLLGEYGMLAVSVDGGLTWTALPVDTRTCLFGLHRGPDASWWVIGDDGVVLRSTDGVHYRSIDTGDWDTRLLSITTLDGAIHVLGYDGGLRRWDGERFVALALEADSALTQVLETRTGAWIVIGDGGMIWRSEDRGESFEEVEVATADDLEAIVALPGGGLLVCGDDATLLFSDDDGRTWTAIPNDLDGHLWTLEPFAGGLLVGGDDGAIWSLEVSATETVLVEDEHDDDDEEDEDDEENDEEDEEDDDDDDEDEDEARPPARFASLEEASERWIREGTAFATELNAYVRRVYDVGPNKAGQEPSETRQDMADYVREQLVALNAAGEHRRARRLFPPAYEPFDYDALGQEVEQVAYLADGRIIARVGATVYELERDRIVPIEGVFAFAQSHDRRFVAKCRDGGIDVHAGWDGPRVRTLPHVLSDLQSATLTAEGEAMLAAGAEGIFWLTEHRRTKLWPEGDDDERVDYPHAALSPNGRFVAVGTKDTSHVVIDRKTGRRYAFDPVSSYPCFAAFHADRPDLVFSSCHALYGSASLAVDLDRLVGSRKEPSRVLDRRAWVRGVAAMPFGYLLADRSGYLWALDFDGQQQWFVFLGSTQTAIDLSPDRKRLVAGQYAGLVIELDLEATASDPNLLTNGPVGDLGRWVFWRGHAPMIW